MDECFIIQPFDGGEYDDRYDQIFEPAIRDAGLKPYRVDRDPKVSVLIHDIEQGIQRARAVVADITEDNPNVWFELGFARAFNKLTILVCAKSRAGFPFDIQHRHVVRYATNTPQEFRKLQQTITERLRACIQRGDVAQAAAKIEPSVKIGELTPNEVAFLAAAVQGAIGDVASGSQIQRSMSEAGFTEAAFGLAAVSLDSKRLINSSTESEFGEPYSVYELTESGRTWLIDNSQHIEMYDKRPKQYSPLSDDDMPF